MNTNHVAGHQARRGWRLALAALALSTAGGAHATPGAEALKLTTVVGSLATWGWVAWNWDGAQTRCERATRVSGWGARDGELRQAGLGLSLHDCTLAARVADTPITLQPILSANAWSTHGAVSGARSAQDVALVPLLRWRTGLGGGLMGGVHLGIGGALLSEPNIGNREKSTMWQFSDHLGVHLEPVDSAWRLGLSYRHVSNGNIREPNQAVDFVGLNLEFKL